MTGVRSFAAALAIAALLLSASGLGPAGAQSPAPVVVTAQLLDYQKGFIFFTSGDGFHVAPNVTIVDAKSGGPATIKPGPRIYARTTFDASGTVTKLELSKTPLPAQGDLSQVAHFAVALSPAVANPDFSRTPSPNDPCAGVRPGKIVAVRFDVTVPPTTRQSDNVFMTTDQSGYNPTAIKLTRIDALHFVLITRLASGTVLHYLYDRGSSASLERNQSNIEAAPRLYCAAQADGQRVPNTVYHWGDETGNSQLPPPQTVPTPYNPAPFPNLPTPHPNAAK